MKRLCLYGLVLLGVSLGGATQTALATGENKITEGRLDAFAPDGKSLGPCPLKHTDVTVEAAGFIARVTVRQQFHNPFADKIEAVYVFPLSQGAAVDRMTMTVGDRMIEGQIKERGEARQIYEQAKAEGKVASLLDQERPNIFTQSVANIEPGEKVDITIAYSETLDWEDGLFAFDFPMVVGPRYIPGGGTAPAPMTSGVPTAQVPDADRITPPVTPEGTRAGHDISITVNLDAGLPVRYLESKQHAVTVEYQGEDKSRAVVKLKDQDTIPNKDFVLQYQTSSDRIEDTLLTHTDERGNFFTLVLQPPKRVRPELIVPKELVFVIDKSGSMSGFPIETAKEAMRLSIEGLHENDTFNLMTFSGGVGFCFDRPVPNTDENRKKALDYLASLQGSGGTEMMKAINACLAGQDDPDRLRVVCFMTDGYVGNDMAIIDAVRQNAGMARVFSFGIGTSVNRFLLDGMARAGRGEVHYILNQQQATGAAERFYERVRMPVLTDIELDFGDLQVEEVYPPRIPDLFSAKPVVVKGRYKTTHRAEMLREKTPGGEVQRPALGPPFPAKGTITLRGTTGEGPFERKIQVTLPGDEPANEVLAPLWARAKVEHLMDQDLSGVQTGNVNPAVKEEILGLGLRYSLLTQFTSFVAVEHVRITEGGQARTVAVPVEMPEGVSYEGVFGRASGLARGKQAMLGQAAASYSYSMRRAAPARPSSAPALAAEMPADALADREEAEALPPAEQKLAPELRGLAEKVKQEGKGGNLTVGQIEVKDGRVEIRVRVTSLSDEVLAKLKELGFIELGRAKAISLLIGTIDVAKLKELAELEAVVGVDPQT
jgi:Ca-activated chloride channel family protein